MDLAQRIAELITPTVEDLGFEVVRVQIQGKERMVIQIMAEPADGSPMGIDGCTDISRAVSALLDVEDPIDGAFVLEVSSPGIDRPLVRPKDFVRYAGFEARLETHRPIDGRRRFKGRLVGLEDENVVIEAEEGRFAIPLVEVQKAKLVMNDELLAAAQAEQAAQAEPTSQE